MPPRESERETHLVVVLASFSGQNPILERHLASTTLTLGLLKQLQRFYVRLSCSRVTYQCGKSQDACQVTDRCTLHKYTSRFWEYADDEGCLLINRLAVQFCTIPVVSLFKTLKSKCEWMFGGGSCGSLPCGVNE